jgi:hypothetical protein
LVQIHPLVQKNPLKLSGFFILIILIYYAI